MQKTGAKKTSLNKLIFKKARDCLFQTGINLETNPQDELDTEELCEEEMTLQKNEFFRIKTEGSDLSPSAMRNLEDFFMRAYN